MGSCESSIKVHPDSIERNVMKKWPQNAENASGLNTCYRVVHRQCFYVEPKKQPFVVHPDIFHTRQEAESCVMKLFDANNRLEWNHSHSLPGRPFVYAWGADCVFAWITATTCSLPP